MAHQLTTPAATSSAEFIALAEDFARRAHDSIGQIRKYTGEPYWVHTQEVARIVAEIGAPPAMIAAAHLHDVLEDVAPKKPEFGREAIRSLFGDDVLDIVDALTDKFTKSNYPGWNRTQRRSSEARRLAACSAEVQTIKAADILSNTKDIAQHDPAFAKIYLREARDSLGMFGLAHPELRERAFLQAVSAARSVPPRPSPGKSVSPQRTASRK